MSSNTQIPILRVDKILDKTTLILTGPNLEQFSEGEKLEILALGPVLADNTPLVIPKAQVEITSHLGQYLIARPELMSHEEQPISALTAWAAKRTVYYRDKLNVEDNSIVGNPASSPIKEGDPVVRRRDLRQVPALLRSTGNPVSESGTQG